MATQESKLIISLVDRASAPARALGATLRRLNEAQIRNNAALGAARMQMLDAVGAGYALAKALGAPITAAIEFESAMADVKKVVDFPTPQAFADLSRDIIELSKRVPMAATGLAAIAAEAGAAGIPREEIAAYTEMVAKLGVAFDMTADAVGEDMTKIKTALGLSLSETSALADAINHLSNSMASKAPQIVDFMKRVGSSGRQYGFTAEQTAAIGSAMIAAGADADVAATSFRNVGRALTRGNQVSKAQAGAFKRLGLTSMGVTKAMQKDADGTFRDVIERIRKLPKHLQASTISQIFGDEARAIAPLIDNLELYDNALQLVAERANYLGSSQKEYDARAATTANNMQLLRNRFAALGITIGAALLPALNDAIKSLGPLIDRVAKLAEQYPGLTRALVLSLGGLIALRVAAIALRYAFLWMKGGVLATAITGLRGVGAAASAASFALLPLRRGLGLAAPSARSAAKASVASASALLSQKQAAFQAALALQDLARKGGVAGTNLAQTTANVRQTGRALSAAQGEMKTATAALTALGPSAFSAAGGVRALGVALKFAFISTGVGAIIAGIAAAGYWIYQNWNGIGEMFTSFGSAFMEALGPVRPVVEAFAGAMVTIWNKIKDLLGPVDESGKSWRAWGAAIGEVVGGGVRGLIDGLAKVGGWLKDIADYAVKAGKAISDFFGSGDSSAAGGGPAATIGDRTRRAVPAVPPGLVLPSTPSPGVGNRLRQPSGPVIEMSPLPSVDGGARAVEDAGAAAGTDIEDGASRGADALSRVADRLEQSLRDGAAALSAVRIPLPTLSPMRAGSAPNANLGQSMPHAGRLPGSN